MTAIRVGDLIAKLQAFPEDALVLTLPYGRDATEFRLLDTVKSEADMTVFGNGILTVQKTSELDKDELEEINANGTVHVGTVVYLYNSN